MIAVFLNTPNVYSRQWHPDQPSLSRPGLLLPSVSAVPTRKPDQTLGPFYEWSWRMGEPWLSLQQPRMTVPGAVGLPVPPPTNPVSRKPWQQPDWTMDAEWLLSRLQKITPKDASIPPTKTPVMNLSQIMSPAWIMDAPWQEMKRKLFTPLSVAAVPPPPTVNPAISWEPLFFPSWDMQSPWLFRPPVPFTKDASLPPTRNPDRAWFSLLFPDWSMQSPWLARPPVPFTADASLPPIRNMEQRAWFCLVPEWLADAQPWQMQRLTKLTPLDASKTPTAAPSINMSQFVNPAWTMDAQWQWDKLVDQVPASTGTIFAPPLVPPLINLSQIFSPSWTMDAQWQWQKFIEQTPTTPTAPAILLRTPDRDFVRIYLSAWELTAPWAWEQLVDQIPQSFLPAPPGKQPDQYCVKLFQPDWTLDEQWILSQAKLFTTGFVGLPIPPTSPPVNMARWMQPEWEMLAPWLVLRKPPQVPPTSFLYIAYQFDVRLGGRPTLSIRTNLVMVMTKRLRLIRGTTQ